MNRHNYDKAVATLRSLPTATVYEAAGKVGDMAPNIRPMLERSRLAGPAYTIRTFPGGTLAVLRAIGAAPAGSVLVIDAGGTDRATVWGGTSTAAAQARGLGGCVTNGAIRDVEEIRAAGFPVYGSGISVRGTLKGHPGWSGIPVTVGDVIVHPGDLVLGDLDGVVVVATGDVIEVAARALEQRAREEEREARLRGGGPIAQVLGL